VNLWKRVKHYPEVILVEGLLDLAVLWLAGFCNANLRLGQPLECTPAAAAL
jgi:hypothetical protein